MRIIITGNDHEKVLPAFTFEEERQNGNAVRLTKIYYHQQFNCNRAEITHRGTEFITNVSENAIRIMLETMIANKGYDAAIIMEEA